MNYFIIIMALSISAFLAGCKSKDSDEKVVTFNLSIKNHDTCLRLEDKENFFLREVEIVENSLSDTVLFGHGIVVPNRLGKMIYMQDGNGVIYYEPALGVRNLSPINSVCFQPYKNKKAEGTLKIRFKRKI